jgi:hypothetical protein
MESWSLGDPELPWMSGNCENQCPLPPTFTPNEKQLGNKGGQFYRNYGGINAALKVSFAPLFVIPNTSGNSLVTIYCPIIPASFAYSASVYPEIYFNPDDPTPAYNPADGPAPNAQIYNVPVAQFYLIDIEVDGIDYPIPHFTYIDPIMASTTGGYTTVQHPELGTLYHQSDFLNNSNSSTLRMTLFGNTSDDFVAFNLDGGLFYSETAAGFIAEEQLGLYLDVHDGDSNTFYQNLSNAFPSGIPNPNIYWSGCGENTDPDLYGDAWHDEDGIISDCCADLNCLNGAGYPWVTPNAPLPKCTFIPLQGTFFWDVNNIPAILDIVQCEYPGFETVGENLVPYSGIDFANQGLEMYQIECKTDSEFITFQVTNQDDDLVEGYEIILDGGNLGFTNSLGEFKTIIENASTNTEHNVNVCHCFTTTGQCAQTLIKIKVTDCDIKDLTINKADCTPISGS